MNFRYDIGFLRAIAVLAVILYHFNIPYFKGGFLGVDIFFVISGFLMTRIILNGIDNNTFSVIDFITKRIKRIIPILLVVLFITLILSILFRDIIELKEYRMYILNSLLFTSNIYYYFHTGYFDTSSQNNIVLHTWSLSVEWQFYLIYPFIILFLYKIFKKNKQLVTRSLLGLLLLSLFLMLFCIKREHINFSFYLMPTRIWEMLLGGFSFIFSSYPFLKRISNKFKSCIVISAYLGLIICVLVWDDKTIVWPSIYTLIPTTFTFIVLLLNCNFKFLKTHFIQYIGNISYSLYLWHWIIWTFTYKILFCNNTHINTLLIAIITVLLSVISYHFIEKPKKTIKLILIGYFLLLFLILGSYKLIEPIQFKYSEEEIKSQFTREDGKVCFIDHKYNRFKDINQEFCMTIDNNKKNVLLIGDSHAAQYSASLREQLPDNINLLQLTKGVTLFSSENIANEKNIDNKEIMTFLFTKFIPENKDKLDYIIMSYNFMENYLEPLDKTIKYIEDYGIKVKIIGQAKIWALTYSKVYKQKNTARFINKESAEINNKLISTYPKKYINIFMLNDIERINKKNGMLYMFDPIHMTKFGTDQIIKHIIKNNLLDL